MQIVVDSLHKLCNAVFTVAIRNTKRRQGPGTEAELAPILNRPSLQMTATEQITHDFGKGENASIVETAAGRILVTRKQYRDAYGEERTTFKAQSLEVGETMVCKATNPFIALTNLYGFVNARRSN